MQHVRVETTIAPSPKPDSLDTNPEGWRLQRSSSFKGLLVISSVSEEASSGRVDRTRAEAGAHVAAQRAAGAGNGPDLDGGSRAQSSAIVDTCA